MRLDALGNQAAARGAGELFETGNHGPTSPTPRYQARMEEIGVEATPFPAPVGGSGQSSPVVADLPAPA